MQKLLHYYGLNLTKLSCAYHQSNSVRNELDIEITAHSRCVFFETINQWQWRQTGAHLVALLAERTLPLPLHLLLLLHHPLPPLVLWLTWWPNKAPLRNCNKGSTGRWQQGELEGGSTRGRFRKSASTSYLSWHTHTHIRIYLFMLINW